MNTVCRLSAKLTLLRYYQAKIQELKAELQLLHEFRHPKYLAAIQKLEADYKEELEFEETSEKVRSFPELFKRDTKVLSEFFGAYLECRLVTGLSPLVQAFISTSPIRSLTCFTVCEVHRHFFSSRSSGLKVALPSFHQCESGWWCKYISMWTGLAKSLESVPSITHMHRPLFTVFIASTILSTRLTVIMCWVSDSNLETASVWFDTLTNFEANLAPKRLQSWLFFEQSEQPYSFTHWISFHLIELFKQLMGYLWDMGYPWDTSWIQQCRSHWY